MTGTYLRRIEEPITNRPVVGWSPTVPAKFSRPRFRLLPEPGPISQRTGPLTDRNSHYRPIARRKARPKNDVPQLPYRNGEGRLLR